VVIGVTELKWRLLHGLSALSYAREEIRVEVDWQLWPSLVAMTCVLCLSMFGFYSVQVKGSAALPVGWQDGQGFLLCATLGSWAFGLAVFKLLKSEIDWRLTTVFCMLGWLCIAWAGSWLRMPAPENATEKYIKTVQRLKLLPGSEIGPKWVGWGLLAGGVFFTLVIPAAGARLWWRTGGGRERAQAREEALRASIARFRMARTANAVDSGAPSLEHEVAANKVWNGAKWGAVWWLLSWIAWSWNVYAAALAGILGCAFIWQLLSGLMAIAELRSAREQDGAEMDGGKA
jgi:hypothetical protein